LQKSYVIFKGGSRNMLTFDDKGGRGGGLKTPKTCLRNI
jgi:hypothetical protein